MFNFEQLFWNSKEQVLSFLNKDIAVTAQGDNLILCPLMRLRDNSEEGEHNLTAKNKKKIYIEKYRRLTLTFQVITPQTTMYHKCHL